MQAIIDLRLEIATSTTDLNRDHKVDSARRDHLTEGGTDHNPHQDDEIMTTGHTLDGPHQIKIEPTGLILETDSKTDHDLRGVVIQKIDTTAR